MGQECEANEELQCIFSYDDGEGGENGDSCDLSLMFFSKGYRFSEFEEKIRLELGMEDGGLEFQYIHPKLKDIKLRLGSDRNLEAMIKCHGNQPCRVYVGKKKEAMKKQMVVPTRCVVLNEFIY